MDGITLLEASFIYTLLFSPLMSMILVLFWASIQMKNTAKIQLVGIVTLLVVGFFMINTSLFLIIQGIVLVLFIIWIFAYRPAFLEGQFNVVLIFFVLQIVYYLLFVLSLNPDINLTYMLLLVAIIPILSMMLLYPWTFGQKKTANANALILIVFIVQMVSIILSLVLSFLTMNR